MFLSQYFCFPLSVSFHQCSVLIFSCCLTRRAKGEAWQLSSKPRPAVQIGTRERWTEQHFTASCHLDTTVAVAARLSVLLFRMWDVLSLQRSYTHNLDLNIFVVSLSPRDSEYKHRRPPPSKSLSHHSWSSSHTLNAADLCSWTNAVQWTVTDNATAGCMKLALW